jgi:hypothetical protein
LIAQPQHREPRRELPRERELFLEEHRVRRIDEDHDVHFLLVMKLLHVRPIEPREDVPVDEPHVVARRIIAVIAELRARPALRREMLAARAIGETPRRIDPQPPKPVEVAVGEKGGELDAAFRHGQAASSATPFATSSTSPGTLRFSASPS